MPVYELSEATLTSFLVQATLFSMVFPATFFAYWWARVPQKLNMVRQELAYLGVNPNTLSEVTNHDHRVRDYLWPVFFSGFLVFVLYSMTNPYVIRSGLWSGVLEEVVDVFGMDTSFSRNVLSGRILFWGWMGAYVYSLNLVLRRFLSFDLTPSVYVFVISRFILAWLTGAIVGVGIGAFSNGAGVNSNINLTTVFVVVFFVGFFPEQGLSWISATAKRTLGQAGGIAKEARLAEIEGISIWQQGRLQQEGIENVQNLAMINIPVLVVSTPFTVGQIIDWVDQSILYVYANEEMYAALENTGIRCASDLITAAGNETSLDQLCSASGLDKNRLKMLYLAVQSSTNVEATCAYRWQASMDPKRRRTALQIRPFEDTATRKTNEMHLLTHSEPRLAQTNEPSASEPEVVEVHAGTKDVNERRTIEVSVKPS